MTAPHKVRRRPAPPVLVAAVAGATAVLAVAGCSSSSSSSNPNDGLVAEQIGISQIAAGSRQAAPALSGTTLQGKALSLSQDAGHVVVLNVWGSWCSDCRQEEPALEETYQKYQAQGVDFLGINTRDDNAAALAYDATFGVTYPSLQDPDETLLLQFKTMIPATDVPATVIIDKQGKVAVRILGAVTEPQLDQQLGYVLGGR
jgi:thiol-disulfide isomerase/thioredoxin